MNNIKELIKRYIIANFENGFDELGENRFNYDREKRGDPLLDVRETKDWEKNPQFDIRKFVNELTDEELLDCLDSQACQRYR